MDFFVGAILFFHDDYQDIYYLLIANMYCFFPQPYLFRNKTGWCWVQIARYKKIAKEWEIKVKAFRKRLDDIQTKLDKHMISMYKCTIAGKQGVSTGNTSSIRLDLIRRDSQEE